MTTDNLTLAVNHATQLLQSRMSNTYGVVGADAKRPRAWREYGFPEHVTYSNLYNIYRRGGVAFGGVSKYISKCWQTAPWVIEGTEDNVTSQWEGKLSAIMDENRWSLFAEADRRRLVGRYSALILRVRDSEAMDKPIKRKNAELIDMVPVWAGALKPIKFNTDMASDDYGKVSMWQYTETIGGQSKYREIHPDRIFILGDSSADAIGFLEPAYNDLINIEKIAGGAGESFLKNAARQIGVEYDKEIDFAQIAAMYGVSMDDLRKRMDKVARDLNVGNDTLMSVQGGTIKPLVAPIADPTNAYTVTMQNISAALNIPSKILVGNQTGERASTEDIKEFNSTCQSRRNGDLTRDISAFIKHLMRIKLIETVTEFTVMWDDLTDGNQREKLENANLMADINQKMFGYSEYLPYTTDMILLATGYDPMESERVEPLGEDE